VLTPGLQPNGLHPNEFRIRALAHKIAAKAIEQRLAQKTRNRLTPTSRRSPDAGIKYLSPVRSEAQAGFVFRCDSRPPDSLCP
jgi:hypothetical protein